MKINKTESRVYQFDARSSTAVVEVKRGISAIRAVRDALVGLVQALSEFPKKRAYLLMIDPKVGAATLQNELDQFKAALRPEISRRLHLVVANDAAIVNASPPIHPSDESLVREQLATAAAAPTPLPPADKQSEVLRVLIQQWIADREPLTSTWLERTVGCSYRTVASMIESLGPAIERLPDRRLRLKYFPSEAWARFLLVAPKARATIYYQDRSDQPRSPESLVRRLWKLDRTDVAVGGAIGAKHHHPDLDLVGTPRLDLCVHAPEKRADLEFVQRLDPALRRMRDTHGPATLALHFVRRKEALFDRASNGRVWADPVECLADLVEARLNVQAEAFQAHLIDQGEKARDGR